MSLFADTSYEGGCGCAMGGEGNETYNYGDEGVSGGGMFRDMSAYTTAVGSSQIFFFIVVCVILIVVIFTDKANDKTFRWVMGGFFVVSLIYVIVADVLGSA